MALSFEGLADLAAARGIPWQDNALPASRFFAAPNGNRLHFLDWPAAGPPLILLHGGALTAQTWDLVALALASDAHCLALDLRGHGLSDWTGTHRIADSVNDLIALIDRLALDRVHLCGMSLGGNVAGHAAPRLGARLASLTFVDVGPGVAFQGSANMRSFFDAIPPLVDLAEITASALRESPTTDPALMAYRYRALFRPVDGGWSLHQDRRRPHDYRHILGRLEELRDLAPSTPCPTLIARGTRSRVLSAEAAAAFAACFPNGRTVDIAGAGHNVQEDAPVALAALLRVQVKSHEHE